ncbi:unnamed protein product [Trichobilharzia regenti]|nr:unnamed protein product [Trichobilharzia regenti]
MFEPCFNTSGGISSPQNNVQQIPPILFRKRTEKIDWRRLASIDVNRIASHVDIESLQEMLTSVTFCDITSEILLLHPDLVNEWQFIESSVTKQRRSSTL